jgi:hypothetical protein
MRLFCIALLSIFLAGAQSSDEEFKVYNDHPRLLLNERRLRLLRRERERQSPRWQQLQALVTGKAQMPEAGFALALFYIVSGDKAAGRRAIDIASRNNTDIRQTAIVYDWCHDLLTEADQAKIVPRLRQAAATPVGNVATARDNAFAALMVEDASAIRRIVVDWWRNRTAKSLANGTSSIRHEDVYPLVELLHSIRDAYNIDLREDAPAVFKDLPLERLLSYYPATYPAPENDFRIPYSLEGVPDLKLAALTRAAELSMVAFDANSQELQFVQGWLLHESFSLRAPFGAPYEFLWANPYQPGLPFQKLPLSFHNKRTGQLLVRSSWEEDAVWLGIVSGKSQLFRDGKPQPVSVGSPLFLGDAAVVGSKGDIRFQVPRDAPLQWFIVGLKPVTLYDIEVDDEDLTEARSDRAGILSIEFTRAENQAVQIRQPRSSNTSTAKRLIAR